MIILRKGLLFLLCTCVLISVFGQNDKDKEERVILSPGLAPVILDQGKLEVNYFGANSWEPELVSLNLPLRLIDSSRRSHFSGVQLTYGFFKDPLFNMGIDLEYNQNTFIPNNELEGIDPQAESYFTIAPRLRWAPFKKIFPKRRSLFFQHTVNFPLGDSSSSPSFNNQMVYIERLGYHFVIQATAAWNIIPSPLEDSKSLYKTPVNLSLIWWPNTRLGFFARGNYSPTLGEVPTTPDKDEMRYIQRSGTHLGGGIQLAYSQRFSLFIGGQILVEGESDFASYRGGGQNSIYWGIRLTN